MLFIQFVDILKLFSPNVDPLSDAEEILRCKEMNSTELSAIFKETINERR